MEGKNVEVVAEKVLQKLEAFVDGVEPDKLSPQSMKHITATLKDIRELTEIPQVGSDTVIRVEFTEPDWTG